MKFEDWVDAESLSADERARLERVHELLLEAGPPATLPSGLEHPPAQVIPFRPSRRRSGLVALLAAAILVGAAFAGGYFTGRGGTGMKEVVVLQGPQNSLASLRVGSSDAVGNTPMELRVSGLPTSKHGYYELFVWRHGKPSYPCTGFRMRGDDTTVRFTVPYELKPGTQLVITQIVRGKSAWPGRVVMHPRATRA